MCGKTTVTAAQLARIVAHDYDSAEYFREIIWDEFVCGIKVNNIYLWTKEEMKRP